MATPTLRVHRWSIALVAGLLIGALAATDSGSAQVQSSANFAVRDLGTLGGLSSKAVAINDDGWVTGSAQTSGGQLHAFLWRPGAVMTDLGTFGGSSSEGLAINNSGWITGYARVRSGQRHAFVWRPGFGMTDLGTLGSPSGGSEGRAISDTGWVTGYSQTSTYAMHAFVWSPEGGMVDLGTLDGAPSSQSQGVAINNEGWVVGNSSGAFLWRPGIGMTAIGTLGGAGSSPAAINNSGWITGHASTTASSLRAFVLTPTEGMADLGAGNNSAGYAINDNGWIAGAPPGGGTAGPGFVWRPDQGVTWIGNRPYAINNQGWVTGGSGNTAFIWTPDDGVQTLDTLLGGYRPVPRDINNNAQMAGSALNNLGYERATLWWKPAVWAGDPYIGTEGVPVTLRGYASEDMTSVIWSAAPSSDVDSGAACVFNDPAALRGTVSCTDDGTFQLTLTGLDSGGTAFQATTTLTLSNGFPRAEMTGSGSYTPVEIGSTAQVEGTIQDPGSNDTLAVTVDWGDGTTTSANVTATTFDATHTYEKAGVYAVWAIVSDDDGATSYHEGRAKYFAVYDPKDGFVTGEGWITSPWGPYRRATFSIEAKYLPGRSLPSGVTEFRFKADDLVFKTDSYDWLVVSHPEMTAVYRGSGTLNGSPGYSFEITVTDGKTVGTTDTFGLRIWNDIDTVYEARDVPVEGGSITIHTVDQIATT